MAVDTESTGFYEAGVNSRAHIHAGAAPGVNTNIITPFTVSPRCSALRVTVCLTTSSVFDVRVTDGTTAYTQHLNGGTALTAACVYTFCFGVRKTSAANGTTDLTYSFRVAPDSVIQTLFAEEVVGALL